MWGEINEAMSRPVQPSDEAADYVPTQILAEWFKSSDADGVAYKSSLRENGHNIALFDIDAAEIERGELTKLNLLTISFHQAGNTWFRAPEETGASGEQTSSGSSA